MEIAAFWMSSVSIRRDPTVATVAAGEALLDADFVPVLAVVLAGAFAADLVGAGGWAAANADEARLLFEQHPSIDVLLTDVVMPGASGPELSRLLVGQRPSLRVIYMSGYTEESIVDHGVINPGIAFLHKPFSAETLGRKIRDVLDR